MEKLEQLLNDATYAEHVANANKATNNFMNAFTLNGINSIRDMRISERNIAAFIDDKVNISIEDLLRFITAKYWDRAKDRAYNQAKLNLLRDVKTLAGIAKDYYE